MLAEHLYGLGPGLGEDQVVPLAFESVGDEIAGTLMILSDK